MKLKVCGNSDPDNLASVLQVGPDYIGFIMYEQSPRYVSPTSLFSLIKLIPPSIRTVGVFVNSSITDVLELSKQAGLDMIQLHGRETPDQTRQIREGWEGELIKVFHVGPDFSPNQTEPYLPWIDFLLFDTSTSKFGGSGKRFDWRALENYTFKKPFFLSGGLGPDIVQKLSGFSFDNLHALDVNSKFEDSPGIKNIQKLQKLKKELDEIEISG